MKQYRMSLCCPFNMMHCTFDFIFAPYILKFSRTSPMWRKGWFYITMMIFLFLWGKHCWLFLGKLKWQVIFDLHILHIKVIFWFWFSYFYWFLQVAMPNLIAISSTWARIMMWWIVRSVCFQPYLCIWYLIQYNG